MEHRYGMRLRGFAPACQPKKGLLRREDDLTGTYYDILVYERKLTEAETTAYELDPLEKSELEPVTKEDLLEVAADDPEQALNLLLLLGPDGCEGYEKEYESLMAEFERLLA